MKFLQFCEYLEGLEKLSSRTEITILLAKLFGVLQLDEIKEATYLCLGRLLPKFDPLEFNISTKIYLKALENLESGIFNNALKINAAERYSKLGDVGEVSYQILECRHQKGGIFEFHEVYTRLKELAEVQGTGSQGAKIEKLQYLFQKSAPIESKFIGRIIVGKLRLGLSDKTVLDALSWFKTGDKSMRPLIERAYGVRSDVGSIAEIVKKWSGEELKQKLSDIEIVPGIPIASKLVEREKSVEAAFERMGPCLVQPKLDGLRAQIHFQRVKQKDGKTCISIFSRNMENMTHMFPDLIKYINDKVDPQISSFVIDSEVIGFDRKTGKLLQFQETIQRKRKYDIGQKAIEVPIKAEAFDLLYLNGNDLSRENLEVRIEKLKKLISSFVLPRFRPAFSDSLVDGEVPLIEMLDSIKVKDRESLNKYFEKQLAEGFEGIIVKKFLTPYEPGTRNFDWIKLKASIKSDMIDEVDGVVLGYYFGAGVRSKLGIGAILVGIYDDSKNKFVTVAKVGTGITDEQFVTIKNDLLRITLEKAPLNYEIDRNLVPDVFVEPKIVVVVEADEITRSKMHTACRDKNGNGLSMRFPRLKVWNRKDKDPEQTTTSTELLSLYNLKGRNN